MPLDFKNMKKQIGEQHQVFQKAKVAKHLFRHIRANFVGHSVQIDLADFSSYKNSQNKNVKYIMFLIDVYSRKLWAFPLTNRDSGKMAKIFEEWLSTVKKLGVRVHNLTGDNEFDNENFHAVCERWGITQYYADPGEKFRTGIVERVIRTMRDKIKLVQSYYDTTRYIHLLGEIVDDYNKSKHRMTEKSPNEVFEMDEVPEKGHDPYIKPLHEGDKVRVLLKRNAFTKGDKPYWSKEIYEVAGRDKYRYILRRNGNEVSKRYAIHQLKPTTQTEDREVPKPDDPYVDEVKDDVPYDEERDRIAKEKRVEKARKELERDEVGYQRADVNEPRMTRAQKKKAAQEAETDAEREEEKAEELPPTPSRPVARPTVRPQVARRRRRGRINK